MIHEILKADKKAPPKQRHTAKRILQRLREAGYQGGRTGVQDEVQRWRQRSAEVFMPPEHPRKPIFHSNGKSWCREGLA
jgi:hypothetical protein